MLTIELEPEIEKGLKRLAKARGVDSVDLIRELVLQLLEDENDLRIAKGRRDNPGRRIPFEEIRRKYGLDD